MCEQSARGREPDKARMLTWLTNTACDREGHVLSWVNPARPGYRYPEAGGLLLTLLAAEESFPSAKRVLVADRLVRGLSHPVGRGGIGYAFDSAMVLSGLLAHMRAGGTLPATSDPGASQPTDDLYAYVADCIARRSALGAGDAAPEGADGRWSTSWGCHLLKMTHALRAHGGRGRPVSADVLIEQLLESLLPLWRAGRFVIHESSDESYLHATCYALEGLLAIPEVERTSEHLQAGAEWLASLQRSDGALPAWHDGVRARGPWPTDVVAQSVRLWAAVDADLFSLEIARGLDRLAALQTAEGGLRYLEGSEDVNSWATTFAVQAVTWARQGATPMSLA